MARRVYLCAVEASVVPARSAALAAVFKPVQPPTTFEETVERLGTAIRLGLLDPGSRLPAERALAEELRISRSTLRQALTTLVQSGHLVVLRGRSGGTFVADSPPLSEAGAELLAREARGVLDYRVAIETGSTMLAAERATGEDMGRLELLTERMATAASFEDYRRADVRFHIGLAEAARSPRLAARTRARRRAGRAARSRRAGVRRARRSGSARRLRRCCPRGPSPRRPAPPRPRRWRPPPRARRARRRRRPGAGA